MERHAFRVLGFVAVAVLIAYLMVGAWMIIATAGQSRQPMVVAVVAVVGTLMFLVVGTGLTVVNPNDARVIQFFGRYVGSIRTAGFHWTWPFTTKRRITLRVRNFETARLKVSDADGNPVEIAAVVVWRVVDSANAAFAVDDHVEYVAVQSETAVRHLATSYPYEAHDSGRPSLRDSAIVAARFKIVEGAVGMVRNALERLSEEEIVDLDDERKAQMVANLLVVLCGDRAVQPVVNTGTLYA